MVDSGAYGITVRGIVQGVGFRPFVYRLALKYGLSGWVINSLGGVEIHIYGSISALDLFVAALRDPPPLARLEELQVTVMPVTDNPPQVFSILPSRSGSSAPSAPPPDASPCPTCLSELFNPFDRRYRYPFINCTDCGPRYTVITDIPYDRPLTTMAPFPMCPACEEEYGEPSEHRFHAQTNCCPKCGPYYFLADKQGVRIAEAGTDYCAIRMVASLLQQGKIIAVKGVGGFHLVADGGNEHAVSLLRHRKKRPEKPFALMVSDTDILSRWCELTGNEEKQLCSPERPIVLLRRKKVSFPAPSVAPNTVYLGVMLPHAPFHYLLFAAHGFQGLVMTSGNLAGSPIIIDNEVAMTSLSGVADYFLFHDRKIVVGNDDSVLRVGAGGRRIFIRRSRSYVPAPIPLATEGPITLAFGSMLKNTLCLARSKSGYLSQHLGNLSHLEMNIRVNQVVEHLCHCLRAVPELVAHDLHPDYPSTRLAQEYADKHGLQLIGVQHHHAHAVSCMAEHKLIEPVIAVVFDGTGYGPDNTIWGGEIMVARLDGFERKGYLSPVKLIGGEVAISQPWRLAVAYLYERFGADILSLELDVVGHYREKIPVLIKMVEAGLNCPISSGCGRLFDGVAALLGLVWEASYEAKAAAKIEMVADVTERGIYKEVVQASGKGVFQIDLLFVSMVEDINQGVIVSKIAARFQNTLALFVAESCRRISEDTCIKRVVLSGGVFQNSMFSGITKHLLEKQGLMVYEHCKTVPGDGGLSLGQAVVARAMIENQGGNIS